MRTFGKLVCKMIGHKRGVRVGEASVGTSKPQTAMFECPRCGAQWTRKVYPRAIKQVPAVPST